MNAGARRGEAGRGAGRVEKVEANKGRSCGVASSDEEQEEERERERESILYVTATAAAETDSGLVVRGLIPRPAADMIRIRVSDDVDPSSMAPPPRVVIASLPPGATRPPCISQILISLLPSSSRAQNSRTPPQHATRSSHLNVAL